MDSVKTVKRIHPLAECEKCPLYGEGHALSDGPEDAEVFILSRSPAYGDTISGRPFSGPSGKLLDHLLRMWGVDRRNAFVTNVVLCRTDKPPPDAISACSGRLQHELRTVNAKRIIACGAEAIGYLAPGTTVRGGRGKRLSTDDGRTIVATFNPAAALRDDVVYPDLIRDFKRALTDPKPYNPPTIEWTEEPNRAIDFIHKIETGARSNMGYVAADIESTGLSALSDILSVAICDGPERAFVIGGNALSPGTNSYRRLRELLENEDFLFIWHNGKFDVKLLRRHGINARVDEDTMLLSYLLDERPGVHSLDYMVADVLDWPDYESESVKKGKKNGFEGFTEWPSLYEYNGFDCVGSYRIFQEIAPKVIDEGMDDVYRELLIPASNVFADVESHGVIYDTRKAREVRDSEILPQIAEHKWRAECIVGNDINLNSHQQVGRYLYEERGISDPKVNRRVDFSSDKETRKYLIERYGDDSNIREFLESLDAFKRLDKLRSTYLDGLISRVDPDGRLRCVFLLHGTESGRTSSRKPNLQNQPRGRLIRQLYVAPKGHVILQADYSQCELRTMAMISGDENMKAIYREGRDFHSETASYHFGPNFSKEQRVKAKNMNFGIGYGQSAYSFAEMYDISLKEAESYVSSWRKQFSTYVDWTKQIHDTVLREGELTSVFGRKRRFHLITDSNKDHALKEGVNFMIQSPASDFHLHAAVILHDALKRVGAHILIIVHDSIVFEVPIPAVDYCRDLIKTVMEMVPLLRLGWRDIPFLVDIGIGPNWGEIE